jgi:two-component system, sensor histidine kinase PdtaS
MDGDRGLACVLLVEDDAVILLDERLKLARGGYDVISLRRGNDAVETAMNAPEVDMLITDIDLGAGMDGIEAARKIVGFKSMPVLFLTSAEESDIEKRASGIGNYAFVKKSSSEEILLEAVGKALSGRHADG